MPAFFPNFNDLRGFASNLNPLNLFSDPEAPAQTASPAPISNTISTSVAGPGPSTLANIASSPVIPTQTSPPIRPSLKNGLSSNSNSLDNGGARRKNSNANVSIRDPEVDSDERVRAKRPVRRKERPLSVRRGTGESTVETRRRKKVPWDVSANARWFPLEIHTNDCFG